MYRSGTTAKSPIHPSLWYPKQLPGPLMYTKCSHGCCSFHQVFPLPESLLMGSAPSRLRASQRGSSCPRQGGDPAPLLLLSMPCF